MSTLNKLIYRLRLKLKDTDATTYSRYEALDAMKETLGELKTTVTKFYTHFNFVIPGEKDKRLPLDCGDSIVNSDMDNLTEDDDTGWPSSFDSLIIEYALILLSPGDYGTKEQAKMLWQQKVLSLASTMNIENNLIDGCYGPKSSRHIKKCRRRCHE
jgi:hypothetical protein